MARPQRTRAAWAVALTALIATGCGAEPKPLPAAPPEPPPPTVSPYDEGVTTAADVFGPGCAQLPGAGAPGSATAMAGLPVAAAVSSNPALTVLSEALRTAKLADRLNGMVETTVFAPTDQAFARYRERLGAQRYSELMADPARLKAKLGYHVIVKRYDRNGLLASPEGGLATLAGGTVKIQPAGDTISVVDGVDNPAKVTCGNVPTANGTVFMIDELLVVARPDQIFRGDS